MSLPAVSKHLKVLERAGLITRGREAQWRPCRIEPRALKDIDDWLQHYRRFYDESFDRLDDYLKTLQAKRRRGKTKKDADRWRRQIASISPATRGRSSACASSTRRAIWSSRRSPIPKHLAQWWGPNGFTTTTSSFDLRPGGVWRFVMHGPDGRDYQNRITFDEVVPPERLVYRHGGGDDVEPVQFRQTITFEDLGGRTRMTWRGDFPSAGRARPRHQGIQSRHRLGADHGATCRIRRENRRVSLSCGVAAKWVCDVRRVLSG